MRWVVIWNAPCAESFTPACGRRRKPSRRSSSQIELGEYVAHVASYSLVADVQFLRNATSGEASSNESENFHLPLGKRIPSPGR
jgi:hypothetical protein